LEAATMSALETWDRVNKTREQIDTYPNSKIGKELRGGALRRRRDSHQHALDDDCRWQDYRTLASREPANRD
jgi:hypothetical protein